MKAMTCQKCQKVLSLYIDSALDPATNAMVESHIEECTACAEEWQLLNRTVHILHNMPQEKAPPSLVHDIHLKLEKKNRLGTLKDWLTAIPLRRASYGVVSLAFAGVVAAALLQNISPLQNDSMQFAGKQETQEESIDAVTDETMGTTLLAKNEEISPKEYYPDIPPLSEYEPGMSKPFPYDYRTDGSEDRKRSAVVNFVDTGSYYQKNRSESFFSYRFPDITPSTKEPNLRIMFFPRNEEERNEQMYSLIHSSSWQARDRVDNSLLLIVPSENLDELASLCSQYKGYSFQSLRNQNQQAHNYRVVTVHWH